ncbi:MAG: hypothetical protein IJJ40_03470 [Clostridia bacterium]|nr:hypothetical protein [Clostridia bacterium]
MEHILHFRLVLPSGLFKECDCTSVFFTAKDNENGENGGGVGIKPGHTNMISVISDPGTLKIKTENEAIEYKLSGGFLEVKDNIVTVLTEKTPN